MAAIHGCDLEVDGVAKRRPKDSGLGKVYQYSWNTYGLSHGMFQKTGLPQPTTEVGSGGFVFLGIGMEVGGLGLCSLISSNDILSEESCAVSRPALLRMFSTLQASLHML